MIISGSTPLIEVGETGGDLFNRKAVKAVGGLRRQSRSALGVEQQADERVRELVRAARRHEQPAVSVVDDSGSPPTAVATKGVPAAMHSNANRGAPSKSDDIAATSKARTIASTSLRMPRKWVLACEPELTHAPLQIGPARAVAREYEVCVRECRDDPRIGVDEHVQRLLRAHQRHRTDERGVRPQSELSPQIPACRHLAGDVRGRDHYDLVGRDPLDPHHSLGIGRGHGDEARGEASDHVTVYPHPHAVGLHRTTCALAR